MQGLDRDRVVYLGTFSKVLFPSLRLGYAIVPNDLVKPFCGARILMDRHPPTADQYVLAAFINEGHLDRHIRRMRGIYAQQRMHLVKLIERRLPAKFGRIQVCDQRMHMVVWLREDIDDRSVVAAAVDRGIAVRAVSPMFAPGTERPGLLLGFGGFTPDQIESSADRLVDIIAAQASRRAGAPVREAFRLLKERAHARDQLRADVQAGFDQLAGGEGRTYDRTSGRQLAKRIKSRGRAARAKKS